MKPQRSYSDPEIACYVLGLDMAEQAQDIQALLAHDDAAAARALKWEAYLLSIVDALPAAEPPDTLLPKIQQTLGMTFTAPDPAPVLGETRTNPPAGTANRPPAPWTRWLRRIRLPALKLPKLAASPRAYAWGIAAGIVIVALAVLLIWADVRTTPRTVVHQAVPLQGR
jgi:hypothetical protein